MKVQLKSTVQDNYGNIYNVFMDNSKDKPIIQVRGQKITHNGSSWYLESLLKNKSDKVHLDYGQNWFVTGMKAVYEEAELMNITNRLDELYKETDNRNAERYEHDW